MQLEVGIPEILLKLFRLKKAENLLRGITSIHQCKEVSLVGQAAALSRLYAKTEGNLEFLLYMAVQMQKKSITIWDQHLLLSLSQELCRIAGSSRSVNLLFRCFEIS